MWLPVTKSALAVDVGMTEDTGVVHWGFAVQAALAEKYGLPVNEVVQTLTFGKAFVYHFVGLEGAFNMADAAAGRHPAFLKMKALGLTPVGMGLLINEMRLTDAPLVTEIRGLGGNMFPPFWEILGTPRG